jgi:hypothetical protein
MRSGGVQPGALDCTGRFVQSRRARDYGIALSRTWWLTGHGLHHRIERCYIATVGLWVVEKRRTLASTAALEATDATTVALSARTAA